MLPLSHNVEESANLDLLDLQYAQLAHKLRSHI